MKIFFVCRTSWRARKIESPSSARDITTRFRTTTLTSDCFRMIFTRAGRDSSATTPTSLLPKHPAKRPKFNFRRRRADVVGQILLPIRFYVASEHLDRQEECLSYLLRARLECNLRSQVDILGNGALYVHLVQVHHFFGTGREHVVQFSILDPEITRGEYRTILHIEKRRHLDLS